MPNLQIVPLIFGELLELYPKVHVFRPAHKFQVSARHARNIDGLCRIFCALRFSVFWSNRLISASDILLHWIKFWRLEAADVLFLF